MSGKRGRSGAWAIVWSRRAEKDMLQLDTKVARRILAKVESAAADPPSHFARLEAADEWKLRVGEHCVLAYLSFTERRVAVARVAHRSTAYPR